MDLALAWDPVAFRADLVVSGGDLATDPGLRTAAIISLLTDRLAEPDDVLPDGTDNRRGFWGDLPVNGDTPGDLIGSRLWLLAREKQVPETARRAESYGREALQWMIDDDVASSVDAVAAFPRLGWLTLTITIHRGAASHTFDLSWRLT